MLSGLREASHKTGVGLRTLERWRSEGLTVRRDGFRLLVDLDHVRAWRRWKSLQNDAAKARRTRDTARGVVGAMVSEQQYERARREWIAAGGREKEQ